MTFIEYKSLSPVQRVIYRIKEFFSLLPGRLKAFFVGIGKFFVNLFKKIGKGLEGYGTRFARGDMGTKGSYLIMGFGNFTRGQVGKGLFYLAAQVLYIVYLWQFGLTYINKFDTLGDTPVQYEIGFRGRKTEIPGSGDDSMKILLYGTLTIMITIAFIIVYIANTKDAYEAEQNHKAGKRNLTLKEEMKDYLDGKYHITMLSFPVLMILVFNILPLLFMILIAFTNFDAENNKKTLFTWVGMENFQEIFKKSEGGSKSFTFLYLTKWTIVWAIFATFTNYIFGMVVALMINKKSIKFKSFWRTLFVVTIAVPQFVSLLLMSQMLAEDGVIPLILGSKYLNILPEGFKFLNGTRLAARVTVIVVNMWVGIPYTILSTTGILMNIPEDLYESARIDGATPVTQFFKITLPYMLFVTTPKLIQDFVGNINNFNVIYLLTKGGPKPEGETMLYNGAGETDLLVTWLFTLSMDQNDYKTAAAVGILVFIVCASLSLITFNLSKSSKNEEEFS